MAHEILVGLNVTDREVYQQYRNAMTPMLERCGGSFRYDFWVSEKLKGQEAHPINRVFVISFPDQATCDSFFGDPGYLAVRKQFFERSVEDTAIISEYQRP